MSSSTGNDYNISAKEKVPKKDQLCKPERGGQGIAIQGPPSFEDVFNALHPKEICMTDLEKMSEADLDEICSLVSSFIDEKLAQTTEEDQVGLTCTVQFLKTSLSTKQSESLIILKAKGATMGNPWFLLDYLS